MIAFTTIENTTMIIIGTAVRIAPIVVGQKRIIGNTTNFRSSKRMISKPTGLGVTSILTGSAIGTRLGAGNGSTEILD
jgi:hypothetical protein